MHKKALAKQLYSFLPRLFFFHEYYFF